MPFPIIYDIVSFLIIVIKLEDIVHCSLGYCIAAIAFSVCVSFCVYRRLQCERDCVGFT